MVTKPYVALPPETIISINLPVKIELGMNKNQVRILSFSSILMKDKVFIMHCLADSNVYNITPHLHKLWLIVDSYVYIRPVVIWSWAQRGSFPWANCDIPWPLITPGTDASQKSERFGLKHTKAVHCSIALSIKLIHEKGQDARHARTVHGAHSTETCTRKSKKLFSF